MSIKKEQGGFSLVELMVSLLIASIITVAVIEVFIANRKMYRVQNEWARLQENGRYAMALLANNIRSAGYLGCATRRAPFVTNTLNNSSDFLWDFTTGIQGFNASGATTWSPTLDSSINSPKGGTDVLTVRVVSEPSIIVTHHPGGTPPGSANIQVNQHNGLDRYDIVMVSDCLNAAIFQITSANPDASGSLAHNTGNGTPGNATKALGKDYTGAEIHQINTVSFYIKNNGGEPSLYRVVGDSPAQELVRNVEDLQLQYGVDNNADGAADIYQLASAVTNWANVVSVRINLLLRSDADNLTVDGKQTYYFNGASQTATDNRLRAVFSRTVTLRNRVR